jgi:hypothetical protein
LSYIELHARSAFSFLEGASAPEELAAAAAALNMCRAHRRSPATSGQPRERPSMALPGRNGAPRGWFLQGSCD